MHFTRRTYEPIPQVTSPWSFFRLEKGSHFPDAKSLGLRPDRHYVVVEDPLYEEIFRTGSSSTTVGALRGMKVEMRYLLLEAEGRAAILLIDPSDEASGRYLLNGIKSGFDLLVSTPGGGRRLLNLGAKADDESLGIGPIEPVSQKIEFLRLASLMNNILAPTIAKRLGVKTTKSRSTMNAVFDGACFPTEEQFKQAHAVLSVSAQSTQ
jgi:hypothetical protein